MCICTSIDADSSVAALIVVGVILYVMGLTEHFVALLFCVIQKKKGQSLF